MSKNIYKKAMENLKIPADLDEKTIKFLQNQQQSVNKTAITANQTKRMSIKRFALIAAALMFSLTMIVSAVAVLYQIQYIPSQGFVENGEYEVYYTPEILTLGNYATVETVTRVKKGDTSELSIIITDTLDKNLKIITENHGEFNLTPTIDYHYSSFGTMGKFQFSNEGGYSSYGYFIKDFPEINEFTLVNGNELAEVKLAPSNPDDVLTAEDSGVSVRFYRMSKGSKVLAYEMYENNFDTKKILEMDFPPYKTVELSGDWVNSPYKLYDENGKQIRLNGLHYSKGPDGLSTIMFLRIGRNEKISRISIENIWSTINMYTFVGMYNNDGAYIPVPADGEELIFDDGLLLYDKNGLTSKLTSVTRKGNELIIYTDTEYDGNDFENHENIENIYMWFTGLLGSMMSGPGFQALTIEGDEDSIKIFATSLRYYINGNWEIIFE